MHVVQHLLQLLQVGYGIDKNPYDIASQLSYTGPSVLSDILTKIGLSNECKTNSNNATTVNEIRQNLEQGRPVLVGVGAGPDAKYTSGGHWMALLAINGDTITISNPGSNQDDQTDNINTFVSNYLSSYILITQPLPTNNTSSGTGNMVSENSLSTDGYTGIYKSGTTGKEFKEYKQNGDAPWAYEAYANGGTIGDSGCCLVADCILCSGYGKDITPIELNSKGAYTVGEGIGYVQYFSSASNSEVINHLKNGGTVMSWTTNPQYAVSQHYMAVIDVSSDGSKVYVSNPNYNGPTGWIDANSYLNAMETYLFIPAGGGSGSYGGASTGITSLDNFLFIGDSGIELADSEIQALGNNITILGVSGSTPGNWTGVTTAGKTYNIGSTVGSYNKNVTLPNKNDVKGICVTLGANGLTSETSNMKKLLDNLLSAYPDTPIFVTGVLHLGEGYTVMSYTAYNDEADEYNNEIKAYCDGKSNLYYIDVSSGLYDNGILKPEYEDDMELTSAGNKIFAQNIKDAILSSGAGNTSGYSVGNLTSNIAQYIVPNDRGGYKIDIDLDEKVEEMLKLLEKSKIKDVDYFLKTSKKREYLKAMLKAELVTQFPDLRSAEEIEKSAKKQAALKDVKKNLPDAINNVELIHATDVKENKSIISTENYETKEELDTALKAKLDDLSSKNINYKNEGNKVYTYTQNGTNYGIEKTSDTTFEIYKISEEKNTEEMEEYVFKSLQNKNVQTKIENLIVNGNITRESVHNMFYTTLNSKAVASGYDVDTMESLYFSYIKKITDSLTKENNTLLDFFSNLFSTETPEDELQGIIRIQRKSIDYENEKEEDPYYLSYIPYDEFTKMCSDNDSEALNHFTINSTGGIIVAQWKATRYEPGGLVNNQTSINLTEKYQEFMTYSSSYEISQSAPISYLSQIYQHTMPFDLLWSLLIYGGDYDFIYDLTNLINNSEITITALDKITQTSQTYTKTIQIANKSEDSAMSTNQQYSTTGKSSSTETATITYTIYTTTCTTELKVSYINSWIAIYTNNSEVLDSPDNKYEEQKVDSSNETTDWEQMSTEELSTEDAFKNVLNQNIKKYIVDYQNNGINSEILNNAKNAILFESENIIDAYIALLRSGNLVVYPSDKLQGVTRNASYKITKKDIQSGISSNPAISLQSSLASNELQARINKVVNRLTSSSSERNKLKDAIEDILVGIYQTGDWDPQISSSITTNYSKIDNVDTNLQITTVTYKYSSSSGQIIEKTDPNDTEDNFITLLKKNGKARGSLRSIAEWFFESIEKNRILCDKLDLMKYLFGIAFGKNYDIDENFSFDMFDPGKMRTTSGTSTLSSQDEEGIYNYLIGQGFTNAGAAGIMGNIACEGSFLPDSVESWYLYGEEYRIEYTRKVDSGEISKNDFIYNGPNGNGYGLVGFTWPPLKESLYEHTVEKGRSIADMEGQLETIIDWIQTYSPDLYNTLQTSNDLYECTYRFMADFENPAVWNIEDRYAAAQKYYK